LGHYYYEAFNRDNVKLVDIKKNPIKDITPTGLRTGTTEYEFDVIIFALGFDAITGTLAQIDLRGSQGQDLGTQLRERLATAYGITVENFPNLFMITGPLSPFANIPVVIDNTADWIGRTILYMREHGHTRMETKKETAEAWREKVHAVFNTTVLPQGARDTHSWYVGANVEGKPVEPLFWLGGVGPYFQECENEISSGLPGFSFSSSSSSSTSTSSRLENGQTATATTTTASDEARESRL
jgi:cyclohexanone monooxygenase